MRQLKRRLSKTNLDDAVMSQNQQKNTTQQIEEEPMKIESEPSSSDNQSAFKHKFTKSTVPPVVLNAQQSSILLSMNQTNSHSNSKSKKHVYKIEDSLKMKAYEELSKSTLMSTNQRQLRRLSKESYYQMLPNINKLKNDPISLN